MALTGLEIYKHLPKTNCGKCGSPTCLAFAMRLAAKKAELKECPDVSDQAKTTLDQASLPPIAKVSIGLNGSKFDVGGETVLFRHDKTFYQPTGLGVAISDSLDDKTLNSKVDSINHLIFDRVGMMVGVNLIALRNDSNDAAKFAQAAEKINARSPLPLVLISKNASSQDAALKAAGKKRPLICGADTSNYEAFGKLAKDNSCPLVVEGKDLDEVAGLTQKLIALGVKDLVIAPKVSGFSDALSLSTQARRLALKKNYRPLGYPVLFFSDRPDAYEETLYASTLIAKYASILIVNGLDTWEHLPLVTIRQNIYTDPQKPVQVEPKLYAVGGAPDEKSPLFVTTNFSLTFYTVTPEIESSKVPAHLLIVDAEGMSVLTAWAAEKFTAEKVLEAIQKYEVEKKISHRKIIIPGYVAIMKGKLEDLLSGWEIIVGPREASGIPNFIKTIWK